jgi:predicted Zn-dependent protease
MERALPSGGARFFVRGGPRRSGYHQTVVRRSLASSVIPAALLLGLPWASPALAGQEADSKRAPAAPAPKASAAASLTFEDVAARAARAREADAPDEAIRWYRRGVAMRPNWDEGWWYAAVLLYDRDRYAEARDAFSRFLALKPGPGPARAMRGLCAFQTGNRATSLRDLARWMAEGSAGNEETRQVAWYHLSILQIRGGQFELALQPMTQLCRSGPESPRIVRAAGLMLLRMATLPEDLPTEKQEMVDAAGRASYSWLALRNDEAKARFRDLLDRFPRAPNAHYCYGLFLMGQDPEAALAEFREEMKVQPGSVYPRLETAFELIKRGDFAAARPYAEAAVQLAPGLFAARNALGRVLVELGELERGIAELGEAARLAPDSPEMFFALARACEKAGRKDEAQRARVTFQRLERIRRTRQTPGLAPGDAAPGSGSPR